MAVVQGFRKPDAARPGPRPAGSHKGAHKAELDKMVAPGRNQVYTPGVFGFFTH
jgi:hypothetical protein